MFLNELTTNQMIIRRYTRKLLWVESRKLKAKQHMPNKPNMSLCPLSQLIP